MVESLKEPEAIPADTTDMVSHKDSNNIKESIDPTEPTKKESVTEPLPFTEQRDNFERLKEMNDDLESKHLESEKKTEREIPIHPLFCRRV